MLRRNKRRTLGFALILAAAAAVFIGISASTHAAAVPAAPSRHVVASNEFTMAHSTGASQSLASTYTSVKGGVCHRCIIAHPYEAALVGA